MDVTRINRERLHFKWNLLIGYAEYVLYTIVYYIIYYILYNVLHVIYTINGPFYFRRNGNPIMNLFTNMKSNKTSKVSSSFMELFSALLAVLWMKQNYKPIINAPLQEQKEKTYKSLYLISLYNSFGKFFHMLLMRDVFFINLFFEDNVYWSSIDHDILSLSHERVFSLEFNSYL